MQVRSTLTPEEYREAALLSRSKYFWLRFFAANWYASIICLLLLGVGVSDLIHHTQPRWDLMALYLAIFGGFIAFSWYRYNGKIAKVGVAQNAARKSVSLDPDGIRTCLNSGADVFVPWSSYSKWVEGKSVFVLTGDSGTTILPATDGNETSLRGLLESKIS